MSKKVYEVKRSIHTKVRDNWWRSEYDTRVFTDEKAAKAYCWSIRPEGKPNYRYGDDENNDRRGYRCWTWGSLMKDEPRIEITWTVRTEE